jgi:hypothetical protein
MRDWADLIGEKLVQDPIITLRDMDTIVFEQYNMHLIDRESFVKSKWAWNITIDAEAQVPSY